MTQDATQNANANPNANADVAAQAAAANADANTNVDPNAGKTAEQIAADKAATDAAAADKTAADKAAGEKGKQGAPEKYEAFKAPEGTTLHESVVTEFQGIAKELNLSQEQAQTLIDKLAPKIAERQTAQLAEVVAEARKGWIESVKADKEIGGAKFDENLATAKRGMNAYCTPDFVKFLDQSGLGDHPEMIRAFHKIGLTVKPDGSHVSGGANNKPNLGQTMYPNSNHPA